MATSELFADIAVTPFVIAVDGREKQAYTFDGLRTDAAKGRHELIVRREWAYLKTGDYSIVGHEDRVCVERKSLEDLYMTLGTHRDRFEAEHERMAAFDLAVVVVEAGWERILSRPPMLSQLNPKTVHRTALSWLVRYGVPWVCVEGRRLAEITTFRLLEKWWSQRRHGDVDQEGEENSAVSLEEKTHD